jgi:hypothetical protein
MAALFLATVVKNRFIIRIIQQIVPLLLLTFLIAVAGCAGLKNDLQYSNPAMVNSDYVREVNGLQITIDPIFDEVRAKEIFDYVFKKVGRC